MKRIILLTTFVLSLTFISFAQTEAAVPNLIQDPVDKFGRLTRDDLKTRMENLYIEILNDPTAEGIVVIEFDKRDKRNKKVSWLKAFEQYFNFRKIDRTRFTFVISESLREQTTLWVLPNGNNKIKEFSENKKRNIKGENLRQAINTIFKKN